MPNNFTSTKVCDCMLTNSYTSWRCTRTPATPQSILPQSWYDSLVPKAEWMVNHVDYQGKTHSTITPYVEMYTQFDVQKLPEHGNCYPQYIYLWYWWSLVPIRAAVVEVIIKERQQHIMLKHTHSFAHTGTARTCQLVSSCCTASSWLSNQG